MPKDVESIIISPLCVDGAEVRSSIKKAEFFINNYQMPAVGNSAPSIGESLVTLNLPEKGFFFTTHSLEKNKWFLSTDEREWDRFVCKQIFDDTL